MSQQLIAGSRALNSQNSRSYDVLNTRPHGGSLGRPRDGGGEGGGGGGGGGGEGMVAVDQVVVDSGEIGGNGD